MLASPVRPPYRIPMLRLLLLIGAVIVVVLVAFAVWHALVFILMAAFVVLVLGLLFGAFRVGRWSSRRR